MARTRYLPLVATVAAVAMALAACGSGSGSGRESSAPAGPNTFVLGEWSITPPAVSMHAGKVDITATNKGRETHELVIVRASDPASFPTKSDGSVDEEQLREADKAGEITDLIAGKSTSKTFDLPAGDYIAFCNLVDQMGKGNRGMGGSGMGGSGMGGSGMGGSGMGGSGSGMGHGHYRLGMVTRFSVV